MVFWTGVILFALGISLFGLTFVLPGPKAQRIINKGLKPNLASLERLASSGEVKEYGEGHTELFRRAVEIQRDQVRPGPDSNWKYQVRPIPLLRLSGALVAAGIVLGIVGLILARLT
jgi:hypothetical protein